MECTGRVTNISRDWQNNKLNITFSLNESVEGELEKIKDVEKLSIKAVKFRKKRSLDANAYMWVLLSKIAEAIHSNKDDVYIEMLSRYGVFTHIIVKKSVVDKVKAEWRTVRELGEINVNGSHGIQLQCYFGSSTYDSKEMATLIDGVVSEAKELGIETLPPDELDRMKQEWDIEINSTKK